MRIGNGPRLVVPRPGIQLPRKWWCRWLDRGKAYDEHRAKERERLRLMTGKVAGDVKHQVTTINGLRPGDHYRLVDGHGREFGARLTATINDRVYRFRVRRVERQPEALHSQLSRMLKRAHKLAMRED